MRTQQQSQTENLAASAKTSDGLFTREIRLERVRAAAWKICVDSLATEEEPESVVRKFSDALGDACWLAQWKRENVIFDFDITMLPELIPQLTHTLANDQDSYDQRIVEDIIATLAKGEL